MAKFFEIMTWIDTHINHPIENFLTDIFDKNNDGRFYDVIFYKFCQFSWNGYNDSHPENFGY